GQHHALDRTALTPALVAELRGLGEALSRVALPGVLKADEPANHFLTDLLIVDELLGDLDRSRTTGHRLVLLRKRPEATVDVLRCENAKAGHGTTPRPANVSRPECRLEQLDRSRRSS